MIKKFLLDRWFPAPKDWAHHTARLYRLRGITKETLIKSIGDEYAKKYRTAAEIAKGR